jgi:hypothetical protein
MNPSDYRRDYAAYHSAAERERFKRHAGLGQPSDLHEIEDRYADLWTREAVADLRRAHEAVPANFETERAGLRALVGAARINYAKARARELTEELRSCEAASRFEWKGAKISTDEATDLLAGEPDAARRRELARRWLDKVRACDDLRAARLGTMEEATGALGQGGARAFYESYAGVDVETLAAASVAFLERTESRFMSQLARWAARELPNGVGSVPEYADQFFFERAASFDARFPARDFRSIYQETLRGLGVRAGSQKNLHVDDERHPSKGALTACFAIEPPEDVRLVVGSRPSGLDFYRHGLREVGHAQMLAWASREQSARYPEFVYAPDAATPQGHGFLLSDLLREPAWLAGRRGVRATESEDAARFAALLDLHDARRDCARLRYALDGAAGARTENRDAEYVAHFKGATGFRHHAATALLDADENFASATALRARLFAVGLGEHLRSRHGWRWHESRAAGDELVDIWNTASRYSVEELARLVWGGEIGFDMLADTLLAAVEGGDGV